MIGRRKMTQAKDHVGAILAIILSSFIILGVVTVIIRSFDLGREKPNPPKGKKGGARRLRRLLVISLLLADGMIAYVNLVNFCQKRR